MDPADVAKAAADAQVPIPTEVDLADGSLEEASHP